MTYAFEQLPRPQRRLLLAIEEKARKSGSWRPWERIKVEPRQAGDAWAAQFHTAHKNNVFCVLERTLPDGTRHLMISSLSSVRPTWPEAQRIKNEICGEMATGIEIYPPQAEVVDDADAYHLWVRVEPLPYSLKHWQMGAS